MLKATAGGGGKGMRLVDVPASSARRSRPPPRRPRPRSATAPCISRRSSRRAPRRDPGAVRPPRRRLDARRARVLDPAASPKAGRGVALAGGRRPETREEMEASVERACPRSATRARHVRVLLGPEGEPYFIEVNCSAAGRAPGHRAPDRDRHRPRAGADRGGRAAGCAPAARRGRAMRSRSGSTPRTLAGLRARARAS